MKKIAQGHLSTALARQYLDEVFAKENVLTRQEFLRQDQVREEIISILQNSQYRLLDEADVLEAIAKEAIEKNRKSLNDGDVEAYIKTIDTDSKQLDVKEEEKVLKDTLKSYKFDKKISNIKFLEQKKDQVVVFYNVETTAHPKNGSKDEKKTFNEVVTLVKKDGTYKFSKMAQAAI